MKKGGKTLTYFSSCRLLPPPKTGPSLLHCPCAAFHGFYLCHSGQEARKGCGPIRSRKVPWAPFAPAPLPSPAGGGWVAKQHKRAAARSGGSLEQGAPLGGSNREIGSTTDCFHLPRWHEHRGAHWPCSNLQPFSAFGGGGGFREHANEVVTFYGGQWL